jgi:uncharacterized lipoprotein YajG
MRFRQADSIEHPLRPTCGSRTNPSMKMNHFSSILVATILIFTSCERRSETVVETSVEEPIKAEPVSATATFETTSLDRAIETYRANPTEQNKAAVDKAFAELDGEIAELKQKAASSTGNEKIETERKLADSRPIATNSVRII